MGGVARVELERAEEGALRGLKGIFFYYKPCSKKLRGGGAERHKLHVGHVFHFFSF